MTGQVNVVDLTVQSPLLQGSGDLGNVADLLLRASNGDQAAWGDILRRYSNLVSATVRSFHLQDADALDAVQMTWLRLAENAHRVRHPERLGGWLSTTARRECLRILRRAQPGPALTDLTPETLVDPSAGPEQRAIDADTAQTLWKLVSELPSRWRAVVQPLFADSPRPDVEVARTAGLPLSGIGPTRARALRQLRRRLDERGLGRGADAVTDAVEEEAEATQGDRTGSHRLDHLLDQAEQALREKLEPKVTDLRIDNSNGIGDARLDDLLYQADVALRAALDDRGSATSGNDQHQAAERKRHQRAPSSDLDVLVDAAVVGDQNAVDGVLRWIRPRVVRYCRSRLGGPDNTSVSADDVAYEVFLAVLTALPSYRDQGRPFIAFVYGIAAHKVADAHRSAVRNRVEPVADVPESSGFANGPEAQVMPDEFAEWMAWLRGTGARHVSTELGPRSASAEWVARLLDTLPGRQRDILFLRFMGFSAEEIAEELGSSLGAVRVAQSRALNRLRTVLQSEEKAGQNRGSYAASSPVDHSRR